MLEPPLFIFSLIPKEKIFFEIQAEVQQEHFLIAINFRLKFFLQFSFFVAGSLAGGERSSLLFNETAQQVRFRQSSLPSNIKLE